MVDVKNLIFFPGVPYFVDGRLVAGRDSLVLMKNRLWSVSGVTALGHDTLSSIIGAETQELHTWSLYFCLPSHTWAHLAWFPVEYFQQLLINGLLLHIYNLISCELNNVYLRMICYNNCFIKKQKWCQRQASGAMEKNFHWNIRTKLISSQHCSCQK